MKFEESMEELNKQLLSAPNYEFFKMFKNYHKIAVKSYPQEFFNFLKQQGFDREISVLQNNAGALLSEIDSYEVDIQKKTIKIKKGLAFLEEPLADISAMIKKNGEIIPNTWQWNLIGSYFADMNNFALIQVAKAIILQENK